MCGCDKQRGIREGGRGVFDACSREVSNAARAVLRVKELKARKQSFNVKAEPRATACRRESAHATGKNMREGMTSSEARRVKEVERAVCELRKANEILKLASAF